MSSLQNNSLPIWPYLLLLCTGIIWGATFSLARLATATGAEPLGLALWQAIGGALFLLILCARRGHWPRWRPRDVACYVWLGLIGTALPGALFFYCAPHLPAGVLAITVATVPLMTYAGSWLLHLDRFSGRRGIGIIAGLAAVVLLVGPDTSLPDPTAAPWIGVALLAALCYTAENVYVGLRIAPGTDMIALLCGMLIAASLLLLPTALLAGELLPLWPWGTAQWAVSAIALISAAAYAMYLSIIQLAGPVFASQVGYVVTLTGVLWGMMIFGERHSVWVWAALALVLVGLALVTPRREPNALPAYATDTLPGD